jgi:hypothetical protein
MNLNKLSDLPDWDDLGFRHEAEEWKPNPTSDACKKLYKQWQQVMTLVIGAIDCIQAEEKEDSFPPAYWENHKAMILGDGFQAGAKIRSSEVGLYVIRMENASIIRKNAQFIKSSVLGMMIETVIDEEHGNVIRDEIDVFRDLFKQWVGTFQKDEYEDEWGLFI